LDLGILEVSSNHGDSMIQGFYDRAADKTVCK